MMTLSQNLCVRNILVVSKMKRAYQTYMRTKKFVEIGAVLA